MARLYRNPVGAAAAAALARLCGVLLAAGLAASLAASRAPSDASPFASLAAALAVLLAAALSCSHTTTLSGLGTLLASVAPTRALASLFPRLLPPLLRGPRVFLRDFSCWRPPLLWFVDSETVMQTIELSDRFDEEASVFMRRICERSGLGPATAMSPGIIAMRTEGGKSTKVNIAGGAAGGAIGEAAKGVQLGRAGLQDALDETKVIMFEVVRDLFEKTGVKPEEIDAVFTSCSCFAPTPSMAAMIVNEFNMRRDVLTYSLAGMGCSSSLVCVDAARHMLRGLPHGSRVLIVNHENITANWYDGRDRSMLVTNCLFRAGGAAAIMTNFADSRNKYELLDSERTHAGRDDDAFGCMGTGVDDDGVRGVFLKSNVVEVAGRALGHMLERLGPRALPASELLKAAASRAKAALSGGGGASASSSKKKDDDASAAAAAASNNKLYTPDFSNAFDHFVLHTGGQAVLDALQKALNLSDAAMAPSRDTLHRYGNTSSASTWYTLAHCEAGVGEGLDGGVPAAARRAARAAKEAAAAGKKAAAAAAAGGGDGGFAPVAVPRRRVGVRKGDRALQLGFGGGFKACGALWRATRDITEAHPVWEEGFVDMPAVHANVARQLAEADAREAAREAEAAARSKLAAASSSFSKGKLFGSRPVSAKSVLE